MTHTTMLVCRNSHVAAAIRAVLPVDTLVVGDISGQVWETIVVSESVRYLRYSSDNADRQVDDWLEWLPTRLQSGGRLIWV
jgi:hypothetical protein